MAGSYDAMKIAKATPTRPWHYVATIQNAAAATGNGTILDTFGSNGVLLQIVGTFVGTVTFNGTVDGTNYVAIRGINKNSGAVANNATAAGLWFIPLDGEIKFKAEITAYTSGSITVVANLMSCVSGIALVS